MSVVETRTVWEYHALNLKKIPGMLTENKFNELARDGWRFVAVAQDYAIFERPARGD